MPSPAYGSAAYGTVPYAGYPWSPPPGSFPLLLLEGAFFNDPLDENPTWFGVDVADLDEFDVTQCGRSTFIDPPAAGSTAFVYDVTRNRDLDPTNPASPYAANLKENCRFRFRMIHDGVTWPICETYTNTLSVPYRTDQRFEAYVDLDLSDGFKILANTPLTGMAPRPKERADLRVAAILNHAGWPLSRRLISTGRTILSAEDISPLSALDALLTIDNTECGRLGVDPAGVLTFLSRRDLTSATRQTTSQATFSDSGVSGTIPYTALAPERSGKLVRTVVEATHPTEPTITVDSGSRLKIKYSREVRDATAAARRATAKHFLAALGSSHLEVPGISVSAEDTPPGYPTGLFGKMASLRVGDRVTVERLSPPAGGAALTQDCFIETKRDHAVRGDHTWQVELGFSYAAPVVTGDKWGPGFGKWGPGHAKWGW